jgi:hypothetical protein
MSPWKDGTVELPLPETGDLQEVSLCGRRPDGDSKEAVRQMTSGIQVRARMKCDFSVISTAMAFFKLYGLVSSGYTG